MKTRIHEALLETARSLDDRLALALEARGPLSLPRRSDACLTGALCRAVAGQQLSTAAARTIWSRVVARTEPDELVPGLRRLDPATLLSCGLSRAKARAIAAILEAEAEGMLDDGHVRRMDHADRIAHLTRIRGVGPWTADMIGIFHCRDADIWPEGDLAARKTLQSLVPRRRNMLRVAERFAPHRSLLALHMWRHADDPPASRERR